MRLQRAGVGRALVPPPALMTCHVEDWVTEPEMSAMRAGGRVQRGGGSWSWQMDAMLLAFRRHRAARREWLAEHDVPRELAAEVIPLRRPSWRGPARVGG